MKKYPVIFFILMVNFGLSQRVRIDPGILKQTFVYAVKNDSALALDVYKVMKDTDKSVKKPAILFVFGGAFVVLAAETTRFHNAYFKFPWRKINMQSFPFPTGSA